MIRNCYGDLFESKANFIVNKTNCIDILESDIGNSVPEKYPHVEKEYLKYLKYCKKKNTNPFGTIQYVPTEQWAMVMVDTKKNNMVVAYDNNYQYIVNAFCNSENGMSNNKTLKYIVKDIFQKARELNAAIAFAYDENNWNMIKQIAESSFQDIDIEFWRKDRAYVNNN